MRFKSYSILIAASLAISSCGKNFLDEKRDSKEVIVRTIADYQAVMDNAAVVNNNASLIFNMVSAAEYYLADKDVNTWKINMPPEINAYLWEKEIYETRESFDWNNSYHRIMVANLALDVEKLSPVNAAEKTVADNTKGHARFVRAYAFYQLAQLFCKPYDAATAGSDLGVPIKLDYDVTVRMPNRSNVAAVYAQIIKDLEEALPLLPEKPQVVFRPGKTAVYTLLAKVYMQMGNWDKVLEYSNEALKIKSDLKDFKDFKALPSMPTDYGKTLNEMFYYAQSAKPSSTFTGMMVTPEVFDLYEADDYRKDAYFNATTKAFKGSFAGLYANFSGYTTSEVYLMRAEACARLNQTDKALADLNELRKYRFPDTKPALAITDQTELIKFVIDERRRELYQRGTRWEDLRRLNKEPQFAVTLTHTFEGRSYSLPPNDIRYTMPLPDNEIQLNNYPQNPR
ncbi:RagB/SusD family nutrient uptake outer membrane protein [Pseudobacter ginsenosidimutans]|uniref:SusD-like starch-binding protein associating with outer membrane n=1 Tax=Pseudobacter ginsenosidimutans TaxID=661488 RepID=A0A4Q7N5G0_9BACT|nr:RagB/SusD family nutrient uptake outer membrane protein [Pseudobacter ginsenosidimutans]QEC44797.1 RagB/SusD family nutrient uptake outer membrane protein [Pseudobacter ginsenosidimutans]RZS76285.1 SusD-like starch-binding protein associating with outer membrane [Pseudobacter ginsenosidimutans]